MKKVLGVEEVRSKQLETIKVASWRIFRWIRVFFEFSIVLEVFFISFIRSVDDTEILLFEYHLQRQVQKMTLYRLIKLFILS